MTRRRKQSKWNTPYCFDDEILDKHGTFSLDEFSKAWVVKLDDGGYQLNVQKNNVVKARYTRVTDLHFVYWMAYDLLMKSQNENWSDMMNVPVIWHQEYKKKVNVEVQND